MTHKENCSDKNMIQRINATNNGRMTGHLCYGDGFKVNPANPHTRGAIYPKPTIIHTYMDNSNLTQLIKQLIGI